MPHLQKLYTELQNRGLALVSINHGDPAETINKYLRENRFTFPVGMGGAPGGSDYGIFKQYAVQAYPTNYLLDAQGKIVRRYVGFSPESLQELRAALARLGVQ